MANHDGIGTTGRRPARARPRAASRRAVEARRLRRKLVGRRWIEVLECFDIGERLSRGRSYARNGQVLDRRSTGAVHAKVQGSRPRRTT